VNVKIHAGYYILECAKNQTGAIAEVSWPMNQACRSWYSINQLRIRHVEWETFTIDPLPRGLYIRLKMSPDAVGLRGEPVAQRLPASGKSRVRTVANSIVPLSVFSHFLRSFA
jgi:hypothetical protein